MKQILFFLCALPLFSQTVINGTVTDAGTGKPIPYVNIWVENGSIGVTSEENGEFSIQTDENKNLVFTAMGYDALIVQASYVKEVKMRPVVFSLDEVVVSKPKRERQIEIGDSKQMELTHLSGQSPWIYAKYFPYKDSYSATEFIKDVIVFTKSDRKSATFKLRIYEVKDDSYPGMDLINEDIIVTVKKGIKKNTIDLSKFNLRIPENGIFIAYEWMIIESNSYSFKVEIEGKKSEYITYAPTVVCNPVEQEHTYKFLGGKWNRGKKNTTQGKYHNKVLEPAINLTLTN